MRRSQSKEEKQELEAARSTYAEFAAQAAASSEPEQARALAATYQSRHDRLTVRKDVESAAARSLCVCREGARRRSSDRRRGGSVWPGGRRSGHHEHRFSDDVHRRAQSADRRADE